MFNLIREMTMRAGDLSYNLERYLIAARKNSLKFKHIGDIEQLKVLRNENEYVLSQDDYFIAYFYVDENDILVAAFVEEQYRNKNILLKFIWFILKYLKLSELKLSDVHSRDTIRAMQKLSDRLSLFWRKDGVDREYSKETIDDFYGTKPTGWILVIKNDGVFEEWPLFFNPNVPDIRQYYDWLFE